MKRFLHSNSSRPSIVSSRLFRLIALTTLAVPTLFISQEAKAQGTWTGSGANADWTNTDNWFGSAVPGNSTTATNIATFDDTAAAKTSNLDSTRSVGRLLFAGSDYTLGSTGGYTLTVGAGNDANYSIMGTAAGTNTIALNVTTANITTSQTLIQLSNNSNLDITGAFTLVRNSNSSAATVINIDSGSTLTTNNFSYTNTGTGGLRLSKSGGGLWKATGAGSGYLTTDRINVAGGTLAIGATGAFGSAELDLNSAAATPIAALVIDTAGVTVSNFISMINGGESGYSRTLGGTFASGAATFSGNVALSAVNTATTAEGKLTDFSAAGTSRVEFTGRVANQGTATNRQGGIIKGGAGTVVLGGANTYSLGTIVRQGTLLANNGSGSATGTGAVAVEAGATLGGTGNITGAVTVAAGGILQGGDTGVASDDLTLAGALTLGDNSVIKLTLGEGLTHSSLARTGANAWTFDLNQSFSFGTEGTVALGTYENIITGLAADPGTVGTWTIVNPGWTGTFTYDSGTIDLHLIAVPEPATWAMLFGGLGMLGFAQRMRHRASL